MLTLADIIWLLTGFTCQDFNSKYIHCLALQTRIWLGHDIKNYLRRFVKENSFNAKKVTFSFPWKIIWDKKKEIENSWVIKIWAHSIVLSKAQKPLVLFLMWGVGSLTSSPKCLSNWLDNLYTIETTYPEFQPKKPWGMICSLTAQIALPGFPGKAAWAVNEHIVPQGFLGWNSGYVVSMV